MSALILLSALFAVCLMQLRVATDILFATEEPFSSPEAPSLFVPFDPSLVGNVFTFRVGGLKFPIFARLEINQTLLAYFPQYFTLLSDRDPDPYCNPSLQLLINEDVNLLSVIRYTENSPACKCIQPFSLREFEYNCSFANEEVVPHGPSREQFQFDVKLIFQATSAMRERRGDECFYQYTTDCEEPNVPTPELDGILDYLSQVAYSLGFRVDDLDVSFPHNRTLMTLSDISIP
eukprot:TRINITY_DN1216_c0_g1_i1.p1 TRINITY_DN1216_c0_g1~~TRINITY_DN1216_c0_g1_i1.p1  ORF type:complete len:234 (-),score=27.00 TRINITY_DN1216_c0_g1_i1:245-946(-)